MSDSGGTPPTTPTELKPKQLQRLHSEEGEKTGRKRGTSIGDGRWRTASFNEPGRIVVVAVDASPNAKNAFEFYLSNIHRQDDLIVITHIPEPPKLPSFSFRGGLNVPTEKWKEIMDDANGKVTKLQGEYEDTCLLKKLHYKVRGESMKNAGEGIIRIAEEEGADMIIMACRGLGLFKRAMLGSVSEYVVKNANRPTMVIPFKKK